MSNGFTEGVLGDICQIKIGGTPARNNPDYWDAEKQSGNSWVTIRDLSTPIVTMTAEQITNNGVLHSNAKLVKTGTVLMSFKLTVGRVAYAGKDLYTNEAIAALENPKVDPNFLYYGLQNWDLLANIDTAIKGVTLNKAKLVQIPVLYPADKCQQAKIAQVLATVDRALAQTDALLAKQQRVKAGLMQELLTRGIDADGNLRQKQNDNVVLYPGWKIKRLSEVAEVSSGVTLGQQISAQNTITLPYLRVFNVQDGYLNLSDVKTVTIRDYELDRYRLQKGDVLMNEGGDFDKLGRGAVWDGQIEPCLHQNHVFRVRANRKILLPDFLALISSSVYGKAFFVLNSKQSTNLASINSTQLKSFPVPCPDLKEQERILEFVGKQNHLQSESQRSYRKLKLLKAGLMQDLLTGRVSVLPLLDESE